MKKIFTIALAAAMVLALIPATALAADETIGSTVSITSDTVYEDNVYTVNSRVAFSVAEGADLTLRNCTVNMTQTGTADSLTDAAIAIQAAGGDSNITLENTTINLGDQYSRGIAFETTGTGTVTLDNSKILFDLTDEGTNSVYSRGVSTYQQGTDTINGPVIENGSEISGCFYPMNIAGDGYANVTIDSSKLSGYCALNTWGTNNTISVSGSTLVGNNYYDGTSDNYSVIPQNTNAEYTLSISDSELVAYQHSDCYEDGIARYLSDDNAANMTLSNVAITLVVDGGSDSVAQAYPSNLSEANKAQITARITTPSDVTANADVTYMVVIPSSVDFGTINKGMDEQTKDFVVAVEDALIDYGASITVENTTENMIMKDKDGTGDKELAFTLAQDAAPDNGVFTFTQEMLAEVEEGVKEFGEAFFASSVSCEPSALTAAGSYKGYMTFEVSYNSAD